MGWQMLKSQPLSTRSSKSATECTNIVQLLPEPVDATVMTSTPLWMAARWRAWAPRSVRPGGRASRSRASTRASSASVATARAGRSSSRSTAHGGKTTASASPVAGTTDAASSRRMSSSRDSTSLSSASTEHASEPPSPARVMQRARAGSHFGRRSGVDRRRQSTAGGRADARGGAWVGVGGCRVVRRVVVVAGGGAAHRLRPRCPRLQPRPWSAVD